MISLIPLSDANPTRNFPAVTIGLIAINILVFLFVQPGFGVSGEATLYFYENAPVPCQLAKECPSLLPGPTEPTLAAFTWALLFSTFMHGGFLHLGGNMLFLWVFGNNIEDYLGKVKFTLFYLLGGIAAGLAHVLWTLRLPALDGGTVEGCLVGAAQTCNGIGQYVPAVGASGAVAAVMGAYLILFPRHKVNVLVPIVIIWTVIKMSAFVVLGLWFVYQFLIGGPDIAGVNDHSGVAWMAHVGGFLFGMVAIFLLGGRPQQPHIAPAWRR